MTPDAQRPGRTPAITDQAATLNDRLDSTARRVTLNRSHVAMLQAEVAEQTGAEDCIYCDDVPGATTTDGSGREMPAHLFLWASPEDCAQDLIETFGVHWCRMLAVDLRDRIRRGGVR